MDPIASSTAYPISMDFQKALLAANASMEMQASSAELVNQLLALMGVGANLDMSA